VLARWHAERQNWERSAELLRQANDIDPFSRSLHIDWAQALSEQSRWEEALREWEVALQVPDELDAESQSPVSDEARAECLAGQARALKELGRAAEARERVAEALGLDADCAEAEELLEELER
jgi:tetratricopeptide (TPR) repeat protein